MEVEGGRVVIGKPGNDADRSSAGGVGAGGNHQRPELTAIGYRHARGHVTAAADAGGVLSLVVEVAKQSIRIGDLLEDGLHEEMVRGNVPQQAIRGDVGVPKAIGKNGGVVKERKKDCREKN